MAWLSALVLALAISLDSLGVGLSYGLKKVKVPFSSLVLLSVVSGAAMLVSMLAGGFLGSLLPEGSCRWLGGVILVVTGLASLCTALRSQASNSSLEQRLFSIRIPALGLVIQVIKEPVRADLDRSGEISPGEALLLGTALALDALGAGLGAALTSFPPVLTSALVGLATLCTLWAGSYLGRRLVRRESSWAALVHGTLLVLLGLERLL